MKLIIGTASEADYAVQTYTTRTYAPVSSIILDMRFIGSAKKELADMVLDFDSVYTGKPVKLYISPKILDIPHDGLHYWGVTGTIFRIIKDLSPALITNYLLENSLERELTIFKQFSLKGLPMSFQETLSAQQNG
jgi:hypothetical protein